MGKLVVKASVQVDNVHVFQIVEHDGNLVTFDGSLVWLTPRDRYAVIRDTTWARGLIVRGDLILLGETC